MTDWKETTLGELPIQIGDGNYSSKYPNASELLDKGIPFISNKDLCNGRISGGDLRYLSDQKHAELLKGHIKTGDVLVSTRANIGDIALVTKEFNDANINAQLVFLRADEKIVHSKYLFYLLSSKKYRQIFQNFSSGSAQAQLPIHSLKRVPIVYPDISEQKEIAGALSSLDDKIELLREENKTLEATAQAIFREWFVNFNFPANSALHNQAGGPIAEGKPYKSSGGKMIDSELGEIPEGWRVGRLSDIAVFLNGLALQKYPPESSTEYLPVIKIKELNSGVSDQTDRSSARLDSKYIVENGDILFSWSGSLIVDIWKHGRGALNQHLFRVTSDKFPKWFYFYWIKEHLPNFQQTAAAKAVTMGHIQRHHLDDALVVIPNGDFMGTADDVFSPMLKKFINNNSQIQTLSTLRDTLLPKLMSGEVSMSQRDV